MRTPEGHVHDFGAAGPEAELQINDWSAVTALLARGDIGFGEGYVAGLWDTPAIEPLVGARARSTRRRCAAMPSRAAGTRLVFRAVDRIVRRNSLARLGPQHPRALRRRQRVLRRVARPGLHLFLGAVRRRATTTSSAGRRASTTASSTGSASASGCSRSAAAGAASPSAPPRRGHAVTAITISPSQKAFADARLDGRADVRLCDYRATAGPLRRRSSRSR